MQQKANNKCDCSRDDDIRVNVENVLIYVDHISIIHTVELDVDSCRLINTIRRNHPVFSLKVL